MIQGPRDVFHGLSCLLASLSGGQSKSLALLRCKMAAADVPFQQIPRFIEVADETVSSPVSMEPAFPNSPTECSYELETEQLRTAPTSAPFQPIKTDSDRSTTSVWPDETAPPQSVRPGFSDGEALDTVQSQHHELFWRYQA